MFSKVKTLSQSILAHLKQSNKCSPDSDDKKVYSDTITCHLLSALTWWCLRVLCWQWWVTSAVEKPLSCLPCLERWRSLKGRSPYGCVASYRSYMLMWSFKRVTRIVSYVLFRDLWHTYHSKLGSRMPPWETTSCLASPMWSRSIAVCWRPVLSLLTWKCFLVVT